MKKLALFFILIANISYAQNLEILLIGALHDYSKAAPQDFSKIHQKIRQFKPDAFFGEYRSKEDERLLMNYWCKSFNNERIERLKAKRPIAEKDLPKVIADLNVTKGALYHYFSGKEAIGLAVISELMTPNYLAFYQDLDIFDGNPIDMLQFHLKDLSRKATDEDITLGCPLNNLVQEMTPINEQFRLNLKQLVDKMQHSVADALRRGQAKGYVKADLDPEAIAHFYYAGIEGSYGAAKVHKSAVTFQSNMQQLALYLNILRGG